MDSGAAGAGECWGSERRWETGSKKERRCGDGVDGTGLKYGSAPSAAKPCSDETEVCGPPVAVLVDVEVDHALQQRPALRRGDDVPEPLSLPAGLQGSSCTPVSTAIHGLSWSAAKSFEFWKTCWKLSPRGSLLARVPAVAIHADDVHVAVAGVVGVRIPTRSRIERPVHHVPDERHVRDAAAAEDVHDVTERRSVVRGRPPRGQVILGLMVERQVHRGAERLDRIGSLDDPRVLGSVRDRAPRHGRAILALCLPIHEGDRALAYGPRLLGGREGGVPLEYSWSIANGRPISDSTRVRACASFPRRADPEKAPRYTP